MSVTVLDDRTALVVIDLQQGIVALPAARTEQVVTHAAALAGAFRENDLPVVWVTVTGVAPGRTEHPLPEGAPPTGWADLVGGLGVQPSDLHLSKQRWGAFSTTDLDEQLRARGVTQVVLAGMTTSWGVESTARHAHELGYHVVLAVDAMTDVDPRAHDHSTTRVFPALGQTGTTSDVLALLATRHGTAPAGAGSAGAAAR